MKERDRKRELERDIERERGKYTECVEERWQMEVQKEKEGGREI